MLRSEIHRAVLKMRRYGAKLRLATHSHSETQVTLVALGNVTEFSTDEQKTIQPLNFVIKPAGLPHSNRFGDSAVLTFQASLPANIGKCLKRKKGLHRWRTFFCPRLAIQFIKLFAERSGERSMPIARDNKLFQILNDISEAESPGTHQKIPPWLQFVSQSVEKEFCNPILIGELARHCGVHPVSLARAHKSAFGMSVTHRIRQLRVSYAAQLLWECETSIGQIALSCGFADQSHFHRVFRSMFGLTPGKFRRMGKKLVNRATS